MSARRHLITDTRRSACLGDVGAPGWDAAVCLNDDDGTETLWLIAPEDGRPSGCACRCCAPHEQGAPAHFPCAAIARHGGPCRNRVREPGGVCASHAGWPADQVRQPPPILDAHRATHGG